MFYRLFFWGGANPRWCRFVPQQRRPFTVMGSRVHLPNRAEDSKVSFSPNARNMHVLEIIVTPPEVWYLIGII